MTTEKYDLHTTEYSVQGWDAILSADMEQLDDIISSRELVMLGETVTAYQAACFVAVDSKWYKAKADGALQPAHGLFLEGGDEADEVRIHRMGKITNAGWAWASLGDPVYLDPDTAGALTQTPPASNRQIIGYAISATSMLVVPIPEIITTQYPIAEPAADNDFLVGQDDPVSWVKKTLAETRIILGIAAATDEAAGIVELAIAAEVDGGTDTERAICPDALAGSNFGKKVAQIMVFDPGTDVTIGNGKAYFVVPDELTGMNLVRVAASVVTAGTNTGSTTIAIYNVTDSAEMLSTLMAIEQGETSTRTSATPGTIDAAEDDVVTGDVLRIDVDAVTTATAPKGLIVEMVFSLP